MVFRFKLRRTPKPAQPSSPDFLKQVNEELYKRNAELAIKNRTLSLLYALYESATQTIEVNALAVQTARTIERSLQLPFFGLAFVNSTHDQCVPLVATGMRSGKLHIFFESTEAVEEEKLKTGHGSAQSKALLAMHRRHVVSQRFVEKFFQCSPSDQHALAEHAIPFFYALPLHINNEPVGFMVIGLDKAFTDIDVFERELIENIRNVIAIAIENARNYHDLFSANIRLQELDRQKTEFLSIASHQLRTPLSIIKGYLELIGDGAYGAPSPELRQILSDMDQSNERLIGLVDEFLDVSRIEQGRTKFLFARADMNELVTDVVKELTDRARDKGLSLQWQPGQSLPLVIMDQEKVRHVVFNFIDNAIKYSLQGVIIVTAVADGKGVNVRVTDTGIGFGKEDEVNFFQKFYRGKNVEGVNVNGTGLGIYVCRQFIETHHGKVWAKSPGLGKGSEFGFWIPLTQPDIALDVAHKPPTSAPQH